MAHWAVYYTISDEEWVCYWLVSATRPISSGIGLLVAGVLKEESLLVYQVFIRLIWEIYDIPFGPEGSLSKGHSFQG
jgi:hypothetical protein